MVEAKSISIKDIFVGPRLREIEDDYATALAASISEVGLQTPISVRATPASKGGKFTLVAGGTRLRACTMLGLEEIDAIIVKADTKTALLLEISENLFRNELSVIDRAVFVQAYRQLWEEKHGKIDKGRNLVPKGQVGPSKIESFSEHVAERLGVSERSAKRIDHLARHLHPDLKSALRGTVVADNQQQLTKLAKLDPALQRRAAIGWRETGDIKKVFRLLDDAPKPEISAAEQSFARLVDLWSRASTDVQARFLAHVGATIETSRENAA